MSAAARRRPPHLNTHLTGIENSTSTRLAVDGRPLSLTARITPPSENSFVLDLKHTADVCVCVRARTVVFDENLFSGSRLAASCVNNTKAMWLKPAVNSGRLKQMAAALNTQGPSGLVPLGGEVPYLGLNWSEPVCGLCPSSVHLYPLKGTSSIHTLTPFPWRIKPPSGSVLHQENTCGAPYRFKCRHCTRL